MARLCDKDGNLIRDDSDITGNDPVDGAYVFRHVPRIIGDRLNSRDAAIYNAGKEAYPAPIKVASFDLSDEAAKTIRENPAYANDPDYAAMMKKKTEFPQKYMTEDKRTIHPSGATSSHTARRFDLIPREGLDILADRYGYGAEIHGDRNYLKGLGDKKFILDRINHIQEHYTKMLNMRSTDKEFKAQDKIDFHSDDVAECIKEHLGAIMWGACFIAQVLEHPEGRRILINEIIHFKK